MQFFIIALIFVVAGFFIGGNIGLYWDPDQTWSPTCWWGALMGFCISFMAYVGE
jgi:uncharacterized membrane protein